jgi:hypothetical protein
MVEDVVICNVLLPAVLEIRQAGQFFVSISQTPSSLNDCAGKCRIIGRYTQVKTLNEFFILREAGRQCRMAKSAVTDK